MKKDTFDLFFEYLTALLLAAILLFFFSSNAQAQTLELRGDSIYLIENRHQTLIDSTLIEKQLQKIEADIRQKDHQILLLEAEKAKILERQKENLNTKLYLVEIREKYNLLRNRKK